MSPFLSRRPLVGSLRALTSAEMVALRCNMAARTGFLLAALHSVAKRVSRGQAYHPTRCSPRLPEDRTARASAATIRSSVPFFEPSRYVPEVEKIARLGVLVLAEPCGDATLFTAAVMGMCRAC